MPFGRQHPTEIYATMAITQAESNSIALVGTGAPELPPPALPQPVAGGDYAGYVKATGFSLERANNMQVVGDEIVAEFNGVYIVSVGWGTFRHSANNATVAFVLGVERGGVLSFSQRPTGHRVANLGDPSNVSGGGTIELLKDDKLSVWLATDVSGNVVLSNANVSINGLKQT